MTNVLNSGFGEPESPGQQAEALKRLQFVMGQLPDLSVPLHPADELSPRVINVKQAQAVSLWGQLQWQISLINAELALCASAGIPVPQSVQKQVFDLIDDVSKLQKDLTCAFPSSPQSSS